MKRVITLGSKTHTATKDEGLFGKASLGGFRVSVLGTFWVRNCMLSLIRFALVSVVVSISITQLSAISPRQIYLPRVVPLARSRTSVCF